MSGRLSLRRGIVVVEEPLTVEIDGERRPAWADTALLGEMREGDEVVVNVAALDLELGSGGFDVVHINLTRGLEGRPARSDGSDGGEEPHVMKLNYTSLQHPVTPAEPPIDPDGDPARRFMHRGGAQNAAKSPVLVLPLHGHLAPAAWAFARAGSGGTGSEPGVSGPNGGEHPPTNGGEHPPEAGQGTPRVGYVQTGGGALPGGLGRDVAELRERGLLCGHITAAPAYGGEREALSVAGALDAAAAQGWDAVLAGPGPGIIGSQTRLGHGGMAALDTAHAALALGLPTLLSPRLSAADPRERHRGVSHHTLTVLSMLLAGVEVPVPSGEAVAIAVLAEAAGWRHALRQESADLAGYAASGLPARTMGRGIDEDPLFYAAPLAAGAALARR